jgi:hypothetical protein
MTILQSEEKEICAYPPCLCLADRGQLFCSQICQKHLAAHDDIPYTCDCEHSKCEQAEDDIEDDSDL